MGLKVETWTVRLRFGSSSLHKGLKVGIKASVWALQLDLDMENQMGRGR